MMAKPPAKRHKPSGGARSDAAPAETAAATGVAHVAAIDAQLAVIDQQWSELLPRREDMERRHAEERAGMEREQAELASRAAPLQTQRDHIAGYLRLVHAQSPRGPEG